MTSSEYGRCMSNAYFTRGLLWAMAAAYTYENATQSREIWLVIAYAILATSNFACSYIEHRRAE